MITQVKTNPDCKNKDSRTIRHVPSAESLFLQKNTRVDFVTTCSSFIITPWMRGYAERPAAITHENINRSNLHQLKLLWIWAILSYCVERAAKETVNRCRSVVGFRNRKWNCFYVLQIMTVQWPLEELNLKSCSVLILMHQKVHFRVEKAEVFTFLNG